MSFLTALQKRESSLIEWLKSNQAWLKDPTGKGLSTERKISDELLTPHLPPGFECGKGIVVEGATGSESKAIDRLVYSRAICGPLLHTEEHSIFPAECVAGAVEITMRLTPAKLRSDVLHLASVRPLKRRRFLAPVPGTSLGAFAFELPGSMGCRTYCIGVPAKKWSIENIAESFKDAQEKANTLVHGLYVLGVGYFQTMPEADQGKKPLLRVYAGDDRLFRFTTSIRQSFDRWHQLPPNVAANLDGYAADSGKVLGIRFSKIPS